MRFCSCCNFPSVITFVFVIFVFVFVLHFCITKFALIYLVILSHCFCFIRCCCYVSTAKKYCYTCYYFSVADTVVTIFLLLFSTTNCCCWYLLRFVCSVSSVALILFSLFALLFLLDIKYGIDCLARFPLAVILFLFFLLSPPRIWQCCFLLFLSPCHSCQTLPLLLLFLL